ncbi:T9SS type A sorting domain-containing protein [Fluviicola sp.]|uniref:T9SS type A sorting domain-containing protein n=1 Tax=Fluviicola sp. TaxID=1917219 RepID=UPI0031CE6E5A
MKQIVTYVSALVLAASTSFGQSTLTVDCYNSNSIYNLYSIDDQVIEYATYGNELAFYVAVIDPATCTPWGTSYNGANTDHSFGNFNENGAYRQRVEYFFAFSMTDSVQLAGMTNMLQTIPAGHSILVYTPITYSYTDVNTVNSNLIQELESRWAPNIIQGNDIMILYGEQGNASSYVEEITQDSGKVSFTTAICNSPLSVNAETIEPKLVVKQDGTTFTLNPNLQTDELQIVDAAGKQVSFVKTDHTIQLQGASAGIYVFQATAAGKTYRSKQLVSF